MPFSHSIPKSAGFVSRLHLTELSVSPGAFTGRLRAVALVLACLLVGFAPYQLQAQALSFLNNYFVSGDHIVRDFQYTNTANGYINGTITVLPRSMDGEGIPDGAEVVAAFLYWQVLEPTSPPSLDPGASALFNGYSITGDKVIPPVGSEPGACGSETAFVRSYRADVLPYLPVGANGTQAVGTHTVGLPPNPNGDSSRPGASLVIVYRVLSGAPWSPLKATVIYEGSLEAHGPQFFSLYVPIGGFYDAVFSNGSLMTNAKITDIWGAVSFDGTTARLLNFTSETSAQAVDDHASTITDTNEYGVLAQQCKVFTTAVFTTRVHSGDGDGLLDAWKTNQGYCDFGVNPTCSGHGDPAWVDLPGATPGEKDIFVQLDYMYAVDHSHEPRGASLSMVTNAFLKQNIHLHFVAGNFIPEDTCTDDLTQTPPLLCMFPNEPGVVAWKLGLEAFKAWPTNLVGSNPPSCNGVCTPRFQPGRKTAITICSSATLWRCQPGALPTQYIH